MARASLLAAALAVGLALTACSGSGDSAATKTAKEDRGVPAVDTCLHAPSLGKLAQATEVSCTTAHEAQVYAIIGLPTAITDPAIKAQVTKALSELTCPDVKAWSGYAGNVPLGLLHTWRFPTKAQIRSGAAWAACLAIVAPGPDRTTLQSTVGSLKDKLAGVASPLPQLGRCAPTHTNKSFTPAFCRRGSKQWVWLGAHPKPAIEFPGGKAMKKLANAQCQRLAAAHGTGAAFVYYPHTAAVWTRSRADWSCWMPVSEVKG